MFFLGNLFYVSCLLINAVAILSEDRFLARINLSPGSHDPGFGAGTEPQSVQAKIVHLIASVRTLMRSTSGAHPICKPHWRKVANTCYSAANNRKYTDYTVRADSRLSRPG